MSFMLEWYKNERCPEGMWIAATADRVHDGFGPTPEAAMAELIGRLAGLAARCWEEHPPWTS